MTVGKILKQATMVDKTPSTLFHVMKSSRKTNRGISMRFLGFVLKVSPKALKPIIYKATKLHENLSDLFC